MNINFSELSNSLKNISFYELSKFTQEYELLRSNLLKSPAEY